MKMLRFRSLGMRASFFVAFFFSTLNFLPSTLFAQGSLTPPGSPGPTMKTLDQVEPRIPIDATHTPGDATSLFKITQPGSYYLTGNITGVAGKDGILIVADGVTLNLNGYALIGVASSLGGIHSTALFSSLVIRNGVVSGWGGTGIQATLASGVLCEDLVVTMNTGLGIQVGTGFTNSTGGVVQRCLATSNGGGGFAVGDGYTLDGCTAAINSGGGIKGGKGCSLAHCVAVATDSNGIGIDLSTGANIQSCVARANSGIAGIRTGDNSVVKDCTSETNTAGVGSNGFSLGANCTIIGCNAVGNDALGIQTGSDSTIQDCTVQGNTGNGIQVVDRCQIIGCNSNGNGSGTTGSGIVGGLRTVVRHCTAAENRKSGIVVTGASVVSENNVGHNGVGGAAAGIDSSGGSGSRIEANQARNNVGTGILGASNDIIIRNYSVTNTTNYNPSSGATFGPIELPSTSTHPTANF